MERPSWSEPSGAACVERTPVERPAWSADGPVLLAHGSVPAAGGTVAPAFTAQAFNFLLNVQLIAARHAFADLEGGVVVGGCMFGVGSWIIIIISKLYTHQMHTVWLDRMDLQY